MNAKRSDKIATGVLYVLSGIIVLILAFLLIYILAKGLPHISWEFITTASNPLTGGGIAVQLFNSIYLLLVTLIISVPLSLGAGIYLSEYANQKHWLTGVVRSAIEVLSSLPSIVVGLFGMLIFVLQFGLGFSVLSGALALTVFNLPLMTRNVEESLRAIPTTQREGGLALGMSRWETAIQVILPAAVPGIITGVILSSGRVFGEAAALIYTAGQTNLPINWTNWNPMSITSPLSLFRPAETLAVHIWALNTEGTIATAQQISAGASAVLIIFVLLFNLGARFLGNRIHKKLTSSN
ncbi:phosphate ABC transporter permease PstA [Lactococcus allomyrinae]|uniref:Phosphate transport system permease protein PstA n=1 Tax=Lactococcus allomyrinae TaxID=2419773 RepID=A0A387BI98_9LACT|nr:phosphate ABC transporter permease PstA [Lactococcus allomyrinae]AYG00747.1 phosphate ABC transporter permease PstA [Lactococcus allomyrinae]